MALRDLPIRTAPLLLTLNLLLGEWILGGCSRAGGAVAAMPQADTTALADAGTVVADVAAVAAADADVAPDQQPVKLLAPLPEPLWGVTTDAIDKLPAILKSLDHLGQKHKPIMRIVFDENQPPSEYAEAVPAIHAKSWILGEILDSLYVKDISVDGYLARTKAYLAAFPDTVDVWEIGNEINGEWLVAKGGSTADVVAKMTGAYDVLHAAGKRTALTLYYNKDCWSAPENEMFAWTNVNVPARLRTGLDYVLVSYYEDDCNGLQPNWNSIFLELRKIFPSAKLGIGECGTTNAATKALYIQRYYGMKVDVPGFVGGYFWWYFHQDMVPDTTALFTALFDAIP